MVRSETKLTFGKHYSYILRFNSQEAFPDDQDAAKESSLLETSVT